VYLIASDEPLLVQEARDAIVQQTTARGFDEHERLHATSDFSWDRLIAASTNQSLFSNKILIELTLPTGKPGNTGSNAIQAYLDNPPPDKLLVIITPKLDSSQLKAKWVKAVEDKGALIVIAPIERAQMASWIKQRMQQVQMSATAEGIALLAEQTQGNLLATSQEITKLSLLYGAKALTTEEINHAIGDSARFDIFQFVDQALLGQAEQTVRILSQLKESATEPTLILWFLCKELRTLCTIASYLKQGERPDGAMQKARVWRTRQPIYQSALRRLPPHQFSQLLCQGAKIDLMIKGMHPGNVWLAINQLALNLAGQKLGAAGC
nr:DNA polymerase III subunit delta [Pseudomonadota bacterium]